MSNPRPPQNLIEYCTDDPNNNDIKAIMSAYAIRLLVDSVKTFWQNAQSIGVSEDLNNYYEPGLYKYDSNEVTNAPVVDTDGHVGYLWVIRWTDRVKQIVFVDDFTSSNRSMYERQMLLTIDGSGNVTNINASAWSFIGNTSDDPNTNNDYNTLTSSAIHALMDNIKTFWERAEYAVGVDINQSVYSEPGLWRINGDSSPASQNLPENQDGFLWTIRQESFIAQVWFNARKDAGDLPKIYVRKIVDTTNNTWSAWRQVAFQDQLDNIHTIYEQAYHTLSSQNVDMNNIINPGIYYVNADQSGYTYSNVPIHEDALMIVYRYSSYIKQMWLSTEGGHDDRIYTRFSTDIGTSWTSWSRLLSHEDECVQRDILLPGNWVQDAGANNALMVETNLKYIFQWNLRPVRLYNLYTGLAVKGSSNARIRIVIVRTNGNIDNLTNVFEPQIWNTNNGRKWLNDNNSQILSTVTINTGDRIEIQLYDGYSNTDDSEDLTVSMEFKRIF